MLISHASSLPISPTQVAFNIASYLDDVAQYPEAEPLSQRTLAIRERVLGAEHSDTKRVQENYNDLLKKMNRK